MTDAPLILLVGHCGPDSYALRSAIARVADGVKVEFAPDESSLQRDLPRASLLLINRLLDGDYELATGVELITTLRQRLGDNAPKLMLVSNFPEAQQQAVEAGALPGFGKKDIYAPETLAKVRAALGLG